jgi:hypothetical protein
MGLAQDGENNYPGHMRFIVALLLLAALLSACSFSKRLFSHKKAQREVVVILDGREISKSEMDKLDPNTIESITILKGKGQVQLFTSKKVDSVVMIRMKKK